MSCFSCRQGGVSSGPFASLNTAYHTGDRPGLVRENRHRFFSRWGLSPDMTVSAGQVHGSNVAVIDDSISVSRNRDPGFFVPECDGLVTARPGLALTAYSADCLLLFFFDPVRKAVAIAHAGWRGIRDNIAGAVVKELVSRFNSNPENLQAAVSPGICFSCFTVGPEVADQFIQKGYNGETCCRKKDNGKYQLNLQEIAGYQLTGCGLEHKKIFLSNMCTVCREDLFFSYRRDNGETGRMTGLIMLQ